MNKQLKYLKIFEAFESVKLSKTLNYIKDESSKSKFMDLLKLIASNIDLPLSKYSDEYFQYLPFNKALKLNFNYDDEVCDANSEQSYPEYGVPGSVCDKGQVDRKWGKSIRKAKCTVCEGTGVKKKTDFEIKWFKFWFDKDGRYITTTGTDGQIRPQITNMAISFGGKIPTLPISRNLDDYIVTGKEYPLNSVLSLPTGSIVSIRIGIPRQNVIGMILKDSYEGTYIIHDDSRCSGASPDGMEWQIYGRYSWVVRSERDMDGTAKLLIPKNEAESFKQLEEEDEDKVDPYTWNAPIHVRYSSFNLTTEKNVEKLLSDAHFAIVLNYLDLTKSEYKKHRTIRQEREESRKGSTYLMSDDEIRQLNIEKYVEEIRKKISISGDLKDFPRTLKRFIGGIYAGIYVLRGRNSSELNNFVENLYRFMSSSPESDDQKMYYEIAERNLKDTIERNIKFNNDVTKSISSLRDMARQENRPDLNTVIDGILDLNKAISNKMGSIEVETLEDVDVFLEKYNSIRRVYKEGNRLRVRDTYYVTENLINTSRAFSYLINIDEPDVTLESIRKFKLFVERL